MITKLIIEVLIGYANYKEHSLMILPDLEGREMPTQSLRSIHSSSNQRLVINIMFYCLPSF